MPGASRGGSAPQITAPAPLPGQQGKKASARAAPCAQAEHGPPPTVSRALSSVWRQRMAQTSSLREDVIARGNMSAQNLQTCRERRALVRVRVGSRSKAPAGSAPTLTSRAAGRNESVPGRSGVLSLLRPADSHQVIHVGARGTPATAHGHPRSRGCRPASALGTRGERTQYPGWGFPGPHSRVGGGRTVQAGAAGPTGPGEGIPPPRSRGAPRLDAAPRPPRLRIASASPDSRRNPSAKSALRLGSAEL